MMQKVKCIYNEEIEHLLTINKVYEVTEEVVDFYSIINDEQVDTAFLKTYFKKEEKTEGTSLACAEGGTKNDQDKVQMELLSACALEEMAEVMTYGRKKYEAHNWRKGMKWSRVLGALLRHTFAYLRGENKDPETGRSHMAHAGCCVMFLIEYEKCKLGEDDRYKNKEE